MVGLPLAPCCVFQRQVLRWSSQGTPNARQAFMAQQWKALVWFLWFFFHQDLSRDGAVGGNE